MSGIEVIRPADDAAWHAARRRDVTASQIGALFGAHEFMSLFELWMVKAGRIERTYKETPAMLRGLFVEAPAVDLLGKRHPDWRIEHNAAENIYYRDPAYRLGATPDVIAFDPVRGKGVVQIKSVEPSIYRAKWLDAEGEPDPPLWIALQATLEAYLTGSSWAAVAPVVIGHGVDMPELEIPVLPGVVEAMRKKSLAFWESIALGEEPAPDFTRDGEVIAALYGDGNPEHEIDLSTDNRIHELVDNRAALAREVASLKAQIEEVDAEVKAKLGAAHVGWLGQGRKLVWKPQERAGFFTPATTIRPLRYPKQKG